MQDVSAHECSGANGRSCPVGIATMDKKKRLKFLIEKKSHNVALYHKNLIQGVRSLMAIMGKKKINHISKKNLLSKFN